MSSFEKQRFKTECKYTNPFKSYKLFLKKYLFFCY